MKSGNCSSLDEVLAEARNQGIAVDAFQKALSGGAVEQQMFLTSISSMVCRFASFDLTRRCVGGTWYRYMRIKDEQILVEEGERGDMIIIPTDEPSYNLVIITVKSDDGGIGGEGSLSLFMREQIKAISGTRQQVREMALI